MIKVDRDFVISKASYTYFAVNLKLLKESLCMMENPI